MAEHAYETPIQEDIITFLECSMLKSLHQCRK